jgi:RNA polymerase sigma-70 factor, ECF subfamily
MEGQMTTARAVRTRADEIEFEIDAPSTDSLRSAANGLEAGLSTGGFRHKSAIEKSPEIDRMVRRAVAGAKQGDGEAVRYLYLRYSDNVYSYVRTVIRDDHEAEDVTQHVFAKLITVIGKYEERGRSFSSWILRLAHNVAIDQLRAQRATPTEEVYCDDQRQDETVLDQSRSLRAALGKLPEDQRSVLVLRHLVGLTPTEIADRLGRSESSVHGLHHRGRRAMQQELVRTESAPFTMNSVTAVAA